MKNLLKMSSSILERLIFLVNNGGRSQRSLVKKTSLEVDKALINLNLIGTISLTKAVLPHMIERLYGQIVIVSSVLGKFGWPYGAAYCASKHALQGYFDSARIELTQHNIQVQTVLPGPVKSNITRHAFTEDVNVQFKETSNYQEIQARKMPTERCAKLMLVGMANNLDELWISENPMLLMTYANQYFPTVFRWFSNEFLLERITKLYMKEN
ncbi:dehydrogenase/reductase SDR family member 7-like [Stylophora pistillata]|uniref:dehydrogenase/reductase SDR family member 7-like n=1 Tax=Stylophora pistillata TaxID=50429 RepID=UPI000C0430AA|nr:dehydrogenase/reductase SDR family member 7-like [Stylophora pistillata]